jgi:hypothetical protein
MTTILAMMCPHLLADERTMLLRLVVMTMLLMTMKSFLSPLNSLTLSPRTGIKFESAATRMELHRIRRAPFLLLRRDAREVVEDDVLHREDPVLAEAEKGSRNDQKDGEK